MRALLALVALAFGAARGQAQANPAVPAPASPAGAQQASPPPRPDPAQGSATKADSTQLSQEVARQRSAGETYLPDADVFTLGDRSVAAHTDVDGPVAVARGNLDVYGTINGNAVALDGDLRVHKGGRVTGNAWAVGGKLLIEGGTVEGEKRSIVIGRPELPLGVTTPPAPLSIAQSIKLVLAWFALLAIIGIGVMIFAEPNLDGVVMALERGFARSFWLGIAGQLGMLPALLVLVVALTITLLGALLVPFAIVAFVIAAAGLVTLGFLAVARLTGGALASDRGTTSPRGVYLRALMIGLTVYLGIWLASALCAASPVVGPIARAVAIAITWVAATLGLGAALSSRAGTQRPGSTSKKGATADEYAWQTPTPVSGVAASRRAKATTGG